MKKFEELLEKTDKNVPVKVKYDDLTGLLSIRSDKMLVTAKVKNLKDVDGKTIESTATFLY